MSKSLEKLKSSRYYGLVLLGVMVLFFYGVFKIGKGSDILVLDSPTRGIDVKVKQAIYALMAEMKEQGRSIIMISEEIPELLGMSDRIFVMKDGRINGEFLRDPVLSEEDLIAKMV